LGSEVDSDLDSDIEEVGKAAKKTKKKAVEASDDDEGNSDVEEDAKPAKKRKGADSEKPTKRAKKDPNAPKRAKSSYMYFMEVNRERIKNENPGASFGEIGKLVGAQWKAMSDNEKKKYEDMANTDKTRYKNEMQDYTPSAAASSSTKKSPKGKKKKDPNAPKRGMSAFMLFSNEIRSKVKQENPELTFGELGKKIGELFKALGSDERAKYDKMAQDEKARYVKQMAAYETKMKHEAVAEDDDEGEDESDGEAAKLPLSDSDEDGVDEDDALPDDSDDDSDDE